MYNFGPKAQRVYDSIYSRIERGELGEGAKLPPLTLLAEQYSVAPLTIRQVLNRLENEGLVSREQGRGTFIKQKVIPSILVVDDEEQIHDLLSLYIKQSGCRPLDAYKAEHGLELLEKESSIVMVFSDVRMPERQDGVDFITKVRRRWSNLPLVVLTGYPDDLEELLGTPECPVLILAKPAWPDQIREALRLGLGAQISNAEAVPVAD